MSYTFRNTEINNEKASVFETKSLLYLIGKSDCKKEIEYITFDCFNDVSGIDKSGNNIWDIQSKNEANLNPKKIGKYFFTLFDNSLSKFRFKEYMFFCQELKDEYKTDNSLKLYHCSNFEAKTFGRIKAGLVEEVKRVKGDSIDYSSEIDTFLSKVVIVEDETTEQEYLKLIIKFKNKALKTDDFYLNIFKELRDIQSVKKNSLIENQTISNILDVISYNRHLKILDIDTFLICRIIGVEIFSHKSIPIYFSVFTNTLPIEDAIDSIQECNSNLSRCLFNKASNKEFWKICETILVHFETNFETNVENVYKTKFGSYSIKYSYLNEVTIKYLIALIIEGSK
ncbi:hypothetical protein [Anditalea andensis]|uniref:CD-NTase associated protein 4-like DNA endonuclease domain-containing protein n=1 Tax=Anditalea andensis TaxID=1048983 RepID=A0A074LEN3_9BACT|nr:hypothetical protein [Anditalea andensis]KEO72247.1 hypothetical protein EL17_18780 [Anditalea andensis]